MCEIIIMCESTQTVVRRFTTMVPTVLFILAEGLQTQNVLKIYESNTIQTLSCNNRISMADLSEATALVCSLKTKKAN